MKRHGWMGPCLITLLTVGPGWGSEPRCCEPPPGSLLQRWHPVGGWCPYGGGLLHWWNPCCFPHGGVPDDYCRKALPRVCWPSYPPFYTWGPPAAACLPPSTQETKTPAAK